MNLRARLAARLRRFVDGLSPGAGEQAFVATNARYWRRRARADGDGVVLVEPQQHPIVAHCNATLAAIVSHARGLVPLFVVSFSRDPGQRRVLASYHPGARFVDLDAPRYWPARAIALVEALRVYLRLGSSDEILALRTERFPYGDLIYDNALLFGVATLRRVDLKVLAVLYAFFVQRRIAQDLLARFPIRTAILSHNIGITGGTLCRSLLAAGVEVLNRSGAGEIILRKCTRPEDAWFYSARPEPRYFDWMMRLPAEVVEPLAEAYLEERLNQQVKHVAVEMAFSRDKRLFEDATAFCDAHGLEPGRPIVFVMLHAFNDHPHSHFARRMLYRDYCDWFEAVLRVARATPEVIWVFKEHPAAEFYPTRDLDLRAVFASVAERHVVFLDRAADFNARSIRYLGHAIVTCLGTAGLEYSCLGIPCVLAGESPYTGFGFTHEPDSIRTHEALLRGIARLSRLDATQVRAARLVMLFELPMIHAQPFLFCPTYEYRRMRTIARDELYADLAALLAAPDPGPLDAQVDTLAAFLRDPNYTQYLNMTRYPFMRGALDAHPAAVPPRIAPHQEDA